MPDSGAIDSEDRRAIYANLRRYAWCLDHADGAGVAATFTREGVIETAARAFRGPVEQSEFVRQAAQQPGFAGRQHHVQPRLIERTDYGYLLTSYWMVVTWHTGAPPFIVYFGYYRDECVIEDGQWRFGKKLIARWQ